MRLSTTGRKVTLVDPDAPSPCVQYEGINGGNRSQYAFLDDGKEARMSSAKPPYRVPLVSEVDALPWNGLTVASTFSGAGGSCFGYRMAGFRVVWANEFVPIAQESYLANAHPGCYLDRRDIKLVQPAEILEQTGLKVGELDLFDGSPPCQAFSTAGKREKGWGSDKVYEHGAKQKNETLFTEYVRLLRGLQPRTFVAENVSGLVKGTAKGFFLEILRDLKACGYRVSCRVLDAQWLGVPQSRQRTIFVGVRDDLGVDPVHPVPLPYFYSVRDALPHLAQVVHDTSGQFSVGDVTDRPSPAITNGVKGLNSVHFKVTGRTGSQFERIEQPLDAPMGAITASGAAQTRYHSQSADAPSPAIVGGRASDVTTSGGGKVVRRKFTIAELKRICGFPDDYVLKGNYAQQWERLGNSVPPVMMAAIAREIRDRILVPLKEKEGR